MSTKSDNYLEQVLEFHETFNQVINEKPVFMTRDQAKARLSFMLEELTELAKACGHDTYGDWQRMLFHESQEVHKEAEKQRENLKPNLVECLDALCDIQYFLSGTIIMMGMRNKFHNAFNEVHSSNMSKACENEVVANLTCDKYKTEGVDTMLQIKSPDKILVLRMPDKKVLKSIRYRPVNLHQFITET